MAEKVCVMVETAKDGYKTAMFYTNGPLWKLGVKGCPCGSGMNLTNEGVVQDLLNRTNMESKTKYVLDDIQIVTRTR